MASASEFLKYEVLPFLHLNHVFNCDPHNCAFYKTIRSHLRSKSKINSSDMIMMPISSKIQGISDIYIFITCFNGLVDSCDICEKVIDHLCENELSCNCNTPKDILKNWEYLSQLIQNGIESHYAEVRRRIQNISKGLQAPCGSCLACELTAAEDKSTSGKHADIPPNTENKCQDQSDESPTASVDSQSASSPSSGASQNCCLTANLMQLYKNYRKSKNELRQIFAFDGIGRALNRHGTMRNLTTTASQNLSTEPPLTAFIRCSGHSTDCLACRNDDFFSVHAQIRQVIVPSFCNVRHDQTTCSVVEHPEIHNKKKTEKSTKKDSSPQNTPKKEETSTSDKNTNPGVQDVGDDVPVKPKQIRAQPINLDLAKYNDLNLVCVAGKPNPYIKKVWLEKYRNGHIALNEIKNGYFLRKSILHDEQNWEKAFSTKVRQHFPRPASCNLPPLPAWINAREYCKLRRAHL